MAPAGPKTGFADDSRSCLQGTLTSSQPSAVLEETREARDAIVHTDDVAGSFYPLPEADALPAIETAMVVRVQMPMASLRLMGLPVRRGFKRRSGAGRRFAGPGWSGAWSATDSVVQIQEKKNDLTTFCNYAGIAREWVGLCATRAARHGTSRPRRTGRFRFHARRVWIRRQGGNRRPYSAQAVTQFTQTLADGTHIQRSSTATVARDSQGRTRTRADHVGDRTAGRLGSQLRTTVFIHDPVASMSYVLDPNAKTVRQMQVSPRGAHAEGHARPGAAGTGRPGASHGRTAMGWLPKPKTWARR